MFSAPTQISTTFYRLQRLSRRLWVRTSLVAGLGLITPLVVGLLAPLVPDALAEVIKSETVAGLLRILASSMLAVTIFSLSVMVTARQAASSQVTPRSHQLLLEDTTTQTVLATFLGAFVYSLFGLIALTTNYTDSRGATVMLGVTLTVIALVVLAILRWIEHLTGLGSVIETTRRVEDAARAALDVRDSAPCMGARLLDDTAPIPSGAQDFCADQTGYVQHIDMNALAEFAAEHEVDLFLLVQPGTMVRQGAPLLRHASGADPKALRAAFTLGDSRVFSQDPRFGIIVLSEIAQRALSPGVNDPGTAIDVLTRLQRLLCRPDMKEEAVQYPRLWMRPVTVDALVHDGFDPIARDGAGVVEVQIRLQKALRPLIQSPDPAMARAARAASARALARAEAALTLPDDMDRLRACLPPYSAASA